MKSQYFLGTDLHYKYFLESIYQDRYGWKSFIIYKKRYTTHLDNDYGDLDVEEKFNFETNSENEFGLKKLFQLENNKLSVKSRLLLVDVGKSIEKLIAISEMFKWGCSDLHYVDNFPEEQNVLNDKNFEEKINEKILQLWDVAVKILERES